LIPEITRSANKFQKEKSLLRENEGIDFPDHFSLESVKERLDEYDVSNVANLQALTDVTIMLCIRPAEIKTLRISNGDVTRYAKNRGQQDIPRVFRLLEKNEERANQLLTWIQEAISSGQLRDPGVLEVKWFNTFLKNDRFLSETGKPLLPRYLRKLGAVFAVVAHGAKNLLEAMTITSEALRHSPNNYAFSAKNYTIVNFRRREQPHDQAKAIKIFDKN
jgi:integrase